MLICANCGVTACKSREFEKAPTTCPMKNSAIYEKIKKEYQKEDVKKLMTSTIEVDNISRGQDTRIEEIIKLSQIMGYEKLGVAFCLALKKEAQILVSILRKNGFEVSSIICKNGGIRKTDLKELEKDERDTTLCNPIGQAMILNEEKTDFNIALGLCVGHDTLFFKYADAPTTVLATKDRVLANNPLGALYCSHSFYAKKLSNV